MSTPWVNTIDLFLVFAFLSTNLYDLDDQLTIKFLFYKMDIEVLTIQSQGRHLRGHFVEFPCHKFSNLFYNVSYMGKTQPASASEILRSKREEPVFGVREFFFFIQTHISVDQFIDSSSVCRSCTKQSCFIFHMKALQIFEDLHYAPPFPIFAKLNENLLKHSHFFKLFA